MGVLLPSLGPTAKQALETPKDGRTIGDGADFEVVPGKWNAPETITEPLVLECRRWLEALNKAEGTAQDGRIRNWLMKLLGGLSGNHSEDTVRMKLAAFTFALAEFPAYCFDDAVLRRAQKHFKSFWPSAGELIEFMEAYQGEVRVRAQRAYKIIDIGPRRPGQVPRGRPWAEGGMEDQREWLRQKGDREREELAAIARKRDEEEGRSPEDWDRLPGEDAHAFVDRIGVKRRKMQDAITKRMKGGIRVIPKTADKPSSPTPEATKPAPAPTRAQVERAWAEFEKSHRQGPPPPPQGSDPPDGERLAGMTPDFTTPEDS
jgi:hypothetical protein